MFFLGGGNTFFGGGKTFWQYLFGVFFVWKGGFWAALKCVSFWGEWFDVKMSVED